MNQEKMRIGHVYQRQDGSRFIVTGLVPGYDHIGYVQDISGMNQGTRSTEDSHTFRDRGIVFAASFLFLVRSRAGNKDSLSGD